MSPILSKKRSHSHRSMKIRKLYNNRGFTIGEMMVATILLLLVSATAALGVGFSTRHYNESKIRSESQMLCATLADIIRTELSNTRTISLKNGNGTVYDLDSFFSSSYPFNHDDGQTYFHSVSVDLDSAEDPFTDVGSGYGELVLGKEVGGKLVGSLLLGSASYTEYDLGARVESIKYDTANKVFHVEMSVGKDKETLVSRSFDVLPLNEIKNITYK